jgi:hypothetical protein
MSENPRFVIARVPSDAASRTSLTRAAAQGSAGRRASPRRRDEERRRLDRGVRGLAAVRDDSGGTTLISRWPSAPTRPRRPQGRDNLDVPVRAASLAA